MFGGNSGHTGTVSEFMRLPISLLWEFRTKGPIVASPVIGGGVVFMGSLDKRFYLLSARDGERLAFLKMNSSISASAAIDDRSLYFATELDDNAVYAMDLIDGKLRWKANISDVSASLTLTRNAVLASSGWGSVHALSIEDGAEMWRFYSQGRMCSPVAVGEGLAYLGCDQGVLYALDVDSGQEVWSRKLSEAIWSSPIIYEGKVYVGCFDGTIFALGGKDGKVIWLFQTGGAVSGSPAVGGRTLFVGSDDGHMYALDADEGGLRWSFEVGTPVTGSPLASPHLVIFGASDGIIRALDSETGQLRWSHQTGRAIVSSPAAWRNQVFVSSMDGSLYAFTVGMGDSSSADHSIP